MLPIVIGAGLGGTFGALSTYFGNKHIDAMLAQSRRKKEERDAKLLRDKTINADDINDSVAGGIVQSANIAQVQNRGALNIPAVQAIMASRLAGQGATAIGQSNARYDMMRMQDDLMTERAEQTLEGSKGNYFDNVLSGLFSGAAVGVNVQESLTEADKIASIGTGIQQATSKKTNNSVNPIMPSTFLNSTVPNNSILTNKNQNFWSAPTVPDINMDMTPPDDFILPDVTIKKNRLGKRYINNQKMNIPNFSF